MSKLDVEIETTFRETIIELGYHIDGCWNLEKQEEVSKKLGKLYFDYIVASFDCDFEGFNSKDKRGIANLMKDMQIYLKESK